MMQCPARGPAAPSLSRAGVTISNQLDGGDKRDWTNLEPPGSPALEAFLYGAPNQARSPSFATAA